MIDRYYPSKHEASKRDYPHARMITRAVVTTAKNGDRNNHRVFGYKRRPGWNAPIPTNHARVVLGRLERDPKYLEKRAKYYRKLYGAGVPLSIFANTPNA